MFFVFASLIALGSLAVIHESDTGGDLSGTDHYGEGHETHDAFVQVLRNGELLADDMASSGRDENIRAPDNIAALSGDGHVLSESDQSANLTQCRDLLASEHEKLFYIAKRMNRLIRKLKVSVQELV